MIIHFCLVKTKKYFVQENPKIRKLSVKEANKLKCAVVISSYLIGLGVLLRNKFTYFQKFVQ